MSRTEEFESRLDAIIRDFSDLSYDEIADSLEDMASKCILRASRV